MAKVVILLQRARQLIQEIAAETVSPRAGIRRLRTVVYFFVLVWRGFTVNRCPIRAAALSYTLLLALIPMLAVALSVSKNFLHDSSANVVPRFVDKVLDAISPELRALPENAEVATQARQEAVAKIQAFIDNINAGALGTVGTVLLIVVGVRLLMTVEQTFNDIWGVQQGRSLWRKVVYYWTTITLGPLLLFLALYFTGRAEFLTVVGRLSVVPGLEKWAMRLLPFAVLWVAFSLLYALMPNTRVRPLAAIAGGLFGGTLWQVNNLLSTLYVSRVVSYSKIYGALGIIPVLLAGLYLSWVIILLGAHVSYAVQNIRAYLQQRIGERIDQRGRERLACRAMYVICEHFMRDQPAPSVEAIAERIGAPASWLNELIYGLQQRGLLNRTANDSAGIVPARPPANITLTDVLAAVRTAPDAVPVTDAMPVDALLAELSTAEQKAAANQSFAALIR